MAGTILISSIIAAAICQIVNQSKTPELEPLYMMTNNETKDTEKVITVDEGEERRAGAKEKKTEEKKEEEAKDGKEGKKEAEEEGNANEEEESKMKKEKRKNTRSTNKGELITPQPAATKAIEKDEDFPAPEFHLSINATTPRKGRAPQHSILPRRERGRAPTKR